MPSDAPARAADPRRTDERLDPLVQQTFLELVREARDNGQTVFMSSHVLSEVEQIADRVGIVREGRIVTVEGFEDLRRRAVRRVEIRFDVGRSISSRPRSTWRPLGIFFGGLALAVGAMTGRRAAVVVVVAVVGVVGYFGNAMAGQAHGLGIVRDLSPFHFYAGGRPRVDGFQVVDLAVLAGAALLVVAAGTVVFTRRDVSV